jgi:hypothetical protein
MLLAISLASADTAPIQNASTVAGKQHQPEPLTQTDRASSIGRKREHAASLVAPATACSGPASSRKGATFPLRLVEQPVWTPRPTPIVNPGFPSLAPNPLGAPV